MMLNSSIRFFAVERITFLYILITSLIIFHLSPQMNKAFELLGYRMIIALIIFALAYFNSIKNWWVLRLSRYAFLGILLSYWYPETFDINRMLPNYDFLLARWEQWIFGFQPALLLSQYYPQHWVSELLYMGYFSYYPLIIGTCLYFYFKDKHFFELFFFTVLFSFFVYYTFYIVFPTAGPQYYFQAIGIENAHAGFFPQVGYYFNEHQALLTSGTNSGFFYDMVDTTQKLGERPTAAFPSSHVGISTVIMILIIKNRRFLLLTLLLPLYLSLVTATVYIQAHYVIDVFAGLITASVLCYLGIQTYSFYTRKYLGMPELIAIFLKEPMAEPIKTPEAKRFSN